MLLPRRALVACSLAATLVACNGARTREIPARPPIASPFLPDQETPPTVPLRAELRLGQASLQKVEDLDVYVKIVNTGNVPLRLYTAFFPMPSVVLELVDDKGKRVPTGPPPVPPKDDGTSDRKAMTPGESLSFYYGGGRLMGGPLPGPGRYWLRFTLHQSKGAQGADWEGEIRSPWASFDYQPKATSPR
ncbi:MAG: hypothetical protein ABI193_19370 [Minicystis sp.]